MTDSNEPTESTDGSFLNTEIILPKFKNWPTKKIYDFENEIMDYEGLEDLNKNINQARMALFKTTDLINKYEREEKEAKLLYDRRHRREFLASTAKTAAERTAKADLMCEDLENDHLMKQQMKDELQRLSHALRYELQTLQGIGNNLRQQIKV